MTDPFVVFSNWYEEAQHGSSIDPAIVALATATRDGRPSVRKVLFRGIREGGFSFFTNYESRKGREMSTNPFAALVFYWSHLDRQVRVEGRVERLSESESDRYFRQRPFQSQVTANVSRQSRPMSDESEFLAQLAEAEASASTTGIARSADWGGFKVLPSVFEFWTRGSHRRHRRLQYVQSGSVWTESVLYP